MQSTIVEISSCDVDLLKRYFSTKTILDVDLDCDEEARLILRAGLTDSSVRHAVSSLKTLREDLEMMGDNSIPGGRQTKNHFRGLRQYSSALEGLATGLVSPSSPNILKSALLCCQIFISIEQVQKNYTAMAKHIIRGLNIMREHQPRPCLSAQGDLMPSAYRQLPLLDVFIIKVFAAPCKFADAASAVDMPATGWPERPESVSPESVEPCNLRKIAPDTRTELVNVATSTLEFLGRVSQIDSAELARGLLKERVALLDSLKSWLNTLDLLQTYIGSELVSVSFLRIFHSILRIILLGTLDSQPGPHAEIEAENDRLLSLAIDVTERVKTYKVCSGSSGG